MTQPNVRSTSESERAAASVSTGDLEIGVAPFGALPDGRPVRQFTLTNGRGMSLAAIDYGCAVTNLIAPDRDGRPADVALGFDTLEGYLSTTNYFGCVVGRHANRIAGGRFTLDGQTYTLATNNAPGGRACHLHGGLVGFDKVLWRAEPIATGEALGVRFRYTSLDGEEGYPGRLEASVDYLLTAEGEFRIDYRATTDAPTLVNLTNHSYFNLAGHDCGSILDHEFSVEADAYLPVSEALIPTGATAAVAGTPFDFRRPVAIGARLGDDHEQLRFAGGYDQCYVLRGAAGALRRAGKLRDPASGRAMEVWTTEPGLQFYSGNFLDGADVGKGGARYGHRAGLCLEAEHFPDGPNQSAFPSPILRPGEEYRQTTVYRFSAE